MASVVKGIDAEMNRYVSAEYQHKLERELSRPLTGGNIKSMTVRTEFFRDAQNAVDVQKIIVVLVTHAGKRIRIPAEVKGFPRPELIAKLELFT